jgi:hypothetical protein
MGDRPFLIAVAGALLPMMSRLSRASVIHDMLGLLITLPTCKQSSAICKRNWFSFFFICLYIFPVFFPRSLLFHFPVRTPLLLSCGVRIKHS